MAEPAGVKRGIGVRVLALCGESVLIQGIEAGLQAREGVEIVMLDASQPDAIQVLDNLSPDIIVFDLTPIQLSCIFTFLRTHPNVVLIGVDIDFDRVLFLSGEWRTLPSLADLMQVIEERIRVKNGGRVFGKEDFL
jgi:hypothetical protein